MLSSEDKILSKTFGNLKYILPEDSSKNSIQNFEKINNGRLSAKNSHCQFERMH